MYQSWKKALFAHEFVVAAIISIAALFPAGLLATFVDSGARRTHQLEFDVVTQVRLANLRHELSARAKALDTVVSIVPELEANDIEQFQRVVSPLLSSLNLRAICWHDVVNNASYRVPDGLPDCDRFELFQSAIFFDYAAPKLMLTQAAGDRRSKSRGFVSVVMDGSSLFSTNHSPGLDETILLNDKVTQSLSRFAFADGMLQFEPASPLGSKSATVYQNLLSLPGIELFYHAALEPFDMTVSFLVLGICWALLTAVGCFVYSLLWRKHFLHVEVTDRTEELAQFAYRTSHDLKSPLSSIKQLMNFALADIDGGQHQRAKEEIGRASVQAQKLENLVADILDLAHADSAQSSLQAWRLHEQLEEFSDLHFNLLRQTGVDVQRAGDDVEVCCDRVRLAQVLDNLLTNSIKYANENPTGRYVKVGFSAQGRWGKLTVEDNGVGLPDSFFAQPAESFTRYRPDLAEGTGLGLSIVRRHVARMGATLTFTPLEVGTKVVLRFPIEVVPASDQSVAA